MPTTYVRRMSRELRRGFALAHDAGHHGDSTKVDVLEHWAEFCADCNELLHDASKRPA